MHHVHGAVHRFACSLKRRWLQQMSGVGDRAAERDGCLACVCAGEYGREWLAESASTCRASSSIRSVKVPKSDDAIRATHGGGVTSAVLSASWATVNATCDCVAIMASMLGGRRFFHRLRRKPIFTHNEFGRTLKRRTIIYRSVLFFPHNDLLPLFELSTYLDVVKITACFN
jgi:hypothetical protein